MKTTPLLLLLLLCAGAAAAQEARVQKLLAAAQPPAGVVFEIMAWRDRSWDWAAPQLRAWADRLRARHPGLELALISHGVEQFELALGAASADSAGIRELARLGAEGMAVHVSGEYAQWKRLGQRDFPAFVDVTPSSDAQLAAYLELGYAHIRLEPPHAAD